MASISFWFAVGVAGVFVLSATYKVPDATPLARTLHALGVRPPFAKFLSIVAPGFEMTIAALVIAAIPTVSPVALFTAAAVFAYAGVRGAWSAEPIPCSCFGSQSKATLGRNQLILSLVLAAIALMLVLYPPSVTLERWALSMALVLSVVMGVRTVLVFALLRDLRVSRIGLSSVYPA
jgi:hypothetical protein